MVGMMAVCGKSANGGAARGPIDDSLFVDLMATWFATPQLRIRQPFHAHDVVPAFHFTRFSIENQSEVECCNRTSTQSLQP
jgi:hypothetical protein